MGELLRDWRQRRRLSQLDLASEAGVSSRHLSFVETGRARPSREMVLHLAEQLDVPLRERNELLLAAGFAPVYGRRGLDDPDMSAVRGARWTSSWPPTSRIRPSSSTGPGTWWRATAASRSSPTAWPRSCSQPPANVLRLSLHPDGLAPRILNLPQWRRHVLHRLAREAHLTGDPQLGALHRELAALPGGTDRTPPNGIAVPLRIRRGRRACCHFLSTVTTFGTAVDLTAAELSIEAFLPADAMTADVLRNDHGAGTASGFRGVVPAP